MTEVKRTHRCTAPRLAVFNHKGGVGKTTLTVNIAAALAEQGRRVLLVDSDPQCNLTSYLVEEMVVNDLLDRSDKKDGETIWSSLKPILEGTGDARLIPPIKQDDNLFLLPGDIRLVEFEQELGTLWADCFQRKLRGFRGMTAMSQLVNQVAKESRIDFVFYDCGPNIGALNRSIILDCDYFLIPAACDLFSLSAVKTLGHILVKWISDWKTISALAPDDASLLPGRPVFLGYIPQRFRTYGGQPTYQYARFLSQIEKHIQNDVVVVLRRLDLNLVPNQSIKIGEVKDFLTLATNAQEKGVAMWKVTVGTPMLRDLAHKSFVRISSKIIERTLGD